MLASDGIFEVLTEATVCEIAAATAAGENLPVLCIGFHHALCVDDSCAIVAHCLSISQIGVQVSSMHL